MRRFQRFNAHGASPRERFECWRAWYTDTVDRALWLDPLADLPVDFRSSGEVLAVGEVIIADLRCGPTVVSWRRDAVDDGRLRLILFYGATGLIGSWDGAGTSNLDGRTIVIGGRTGTGWWCAPAGLRAIQLSVPAVGLGERIFVRLLSGEPVNAALVRPMLLGMAGRLGDLSNTSGLDDICRSLVVMLVQSLYRGGPGDGSGDRNGSDRAAALRSRAWQFVDSHLSDPRLCPADIAAALYVSRRTLYRVLGPGGAGVAAAIRVRRLRLARRLLLDPALRGRPIAQIAAEVGLPNPAHFSRLFRAEFGRSPREVRLGAG